MNLKMAAIAAAALCGLIMAGGTGSAMAAETSSPNAASTTTETGYVTTQGRRGGGFRGGGGGRGSFRAVGGGGRGYVGSRGRSNFGRNVAIGVGAAVLGGVILSQGARAYGGNSCGRWEYQCNQGAGWACRNLDRYC